MSEVELAQGGDRDFDRALADLRDGLAGPPQGEAEARLLAERMALLLQGALLVRHAPPAIAAAFCATRLGGRWGRSYGTLPTGLDIDHVLDRKGA